MKNLLYINREIHPLDVLEDIAECENFTFTRSSPDELDLSISGKNCNYNINFNWNNKLEGIHVALFFDTKIPQYRLDEVYKLTIKINELMWLGHFDVWDKEGLIIYRNSSIIDRTNLNLETIETLLLDAVNSIDLYFPAFQYILWAGKTSEEALSTVLFETRGEA